MDKYIRWQLMRHPTPFLARCAAHRAHTQKIEQEIKDAVGIVIVGIILGYFAAAAILPA